MEKGIKCSFYDCRDLIKTVQDSWNPSVEATEHSVLEPFFKTEIIVLDDLGSAPMSTEWVKEQTYFMLNTRYNMAKTTIITTNYSDLPAGGAIQERVGRPESYSPAVLANRQWTLGDRVTDRIRSRLHEMCRIVKMEGVNYREYRGASCD